MIRYLLANLVGALLILAGGSGTVATLARVLPPEYFVLFGCVLLTLLGVFLATRAPAEVDE